jgi:hypothetical protein
MIGLDLGRLHPRIRIRIDRRRESGERNKGLFIEYVSFLIDGSESVMESRFKVNDWVICTREKYGLSPGKRAKNISPAPRGDLYSYEVDKYWIVRSVSDQDLVLETRTGKQHLVPLKDRRIRVASWWERWIYRNRFPAKNTISPSQTHPEVDPTAFASDQSISQAATHSGGSRLPRGA